MNKVNDFLQDVANAQDANGNRPIRNITLNPLLSGGFLYCSVDDPRPECQFAINECLASRIPDVKAFIDSFGPSGWRGYNPNLYNALFMLGETHPNDRTLAEGAPKGKTCTGDNAPGHAPFMSVVGFNISTLAGRSAGAVICQWAYPQHDGACWAFPQVFDPPYKNTP